MDDQQSRKKLNTRTLYAVIASLICTRLAGIPVVLGGLGWAGNFAVELLLAIFLVGLMVRTRNETGIRLLILGAAVGIIELFADHTAVASGTLIYNPNEPFIASSPLYMPLVWLNRMTQIGFIGTYLYPRIGMLRASLTTAAIGVIVMPLGEWVAHQGGFWIYRSPRMLQGVPLYIIICELATCASIVPIYSLFAERKRAWQLVAGALVGLVVMISGEIGFIVETGKPYIAGITEKPTAFPMTEPLPWSER